MRSTLSDPMPEVFLPCNGAFSDQTESQCSPGDLLVIFSGRNVLLASSPDGGNALPETADFSSGFRLPRERILAGTIGKRKCFGAFFRDDEKIEANHRVFASDVRNALATLSSAEASAVARAKELLLWRSSMQFCGKCGKLLDASGTDTALVCKSCGAKFYPKISPAVIVAITKGDKILLAHNRKFSDNVYSLIAGFVEAGETLEEAVMREVMEETGVKIGNVKYLGSQSWPFPDSLMIGFSAEYVSGEERPDGEEIESLGWFAKDALPLIPKPGSISRRIIEAFRDGKL